MKTTVGKYNLPDIDILQSDNEKDFIIWIPDQIYIILGKSNNMEDSLFIDKVNDDRIPVLKRPSGGETVIISPKTIVIAVKLPLEETLNTNDYFRIINDTIKDSLIKLGIQQIYSKGISDISIGDKKILGSAMYKRPKHIFYHAVLNHHEEGAIFDKYLKHPSKEPEYRVGRKHSDFVTSIQSAAFSVSIKQVEQKLQEHFKNKFSE